ncbi:MAG: ribosome maturation factor RimM [Thermodesulfobacteriota bacterium]|nr:ribosome maturation factor RimM [Thermodesulfobacteriota bacterium]
MGADLIEVARIKGPRGLKGEMLIHWYGDIVNLREHYTRLIVGLQGNSRKITSIKPSGRFYALALEGIDDCSKAEVLKGESLFVRREWLPEPGKDESYWCDLMGLLVVDTQDRPLGRIVDIFSTKGNDVYVVDKQKQYLIPATMDIVREISVEKGRMVIDATLLGDLMDRDPMDS